MRITTQMLNETAKKSGLPINNTSLLNYLNNDSSEDNSLLRALSKNTAVDTVTKTSYEKLEAAADQLLQAAEVFTDDGEDSVFASARESGSNEEILDAAKTLVEQYNTVMSALKTASGSLNAYYRQMLSEIVSENSTALKNIGITSASDGTLSIDEETLLAADVDDLEQVLGTASTFSTKVGVMATHISDNAQSYLESLSSQYTSSGTFCSALLSKYDVLG